MSAVVLSCLAAAGLMTLASADHHEADVIELAAIAAQPEPAKDATVMDREGHVLKLGDNGWVRGPIRPRFQETPPMCHEGVRMEWADAYLNEMGYALGMLRVCYMLAGDDGANNIDPYSAGQTRPPPHEETGPLGLGGSNSSGRPTRSELREPD